MKDRKPHRKTVRETRYGCFVEMVLFALFLGLVAHFIMVVIQSLD